MMISWEGRWMEKPRRWRDGRTDANGEGRKRRERNKRER